jgi:hypothetical protein
MILELLFSIALFINGGHLIDNKFKVHHYSDEDYKEIFFLKNNKSISKECIRHSKLENIKKLHRSRPDGAQDPIYKVSDPYPIQDTPQEDTFNSQRSY